jgi:hypothetical protein
MRSVNHVLLIFWRPGESLELWRWGIMAFGFSLVAHGLLRNHMTWPDYSTWRGFWFGRITKKRWQIVYKRTLFVLLGIGMVFMAFTYDLES